MFLYILFDFQNAIIRPHRLQNRATFEDFRLPLTNMANSILAFYEDSNEFLSLHGFETAFLNGYVKVTAFNCVYLYNYLYITRCSRETIGTRTE